MPSQLSPYPISDVSQASDIYSPNNVQAARNVTAGGAVIGNRYLTAAATTVASASAVVDPSAAPTLGTTTGTMAAGTYYVAFAQMNALGRSNLSPVASITLNGSQAITSTAALATNATTIVWFVSSAVNGTTLLQYTTNTGGAVTITGVGTGVAPPTSNTTGAEVSDTVRALMPTWGDGRASDSSFGVWKSTTNLCGNGGFETNTTGWTLAGATSVTRVGSPQAQFGLWDGLWQTPGSIANEGAYYAFAGAAATQYTVSAYVYGVAGGTVRIALYDNVTGKQASSAFTLVNLQWNRITFTGTTGAASTTFRVYIETSGTAALSWNVDGVQVEPGPFATPYVEASAGTSVARPTGGITVANAQAILDTYTGWVAFAYRWGYNASAGGTHGWFNWTSGTGDRFDIEYDTVNIGFFRRTVASPTNGVSQAATAVVGNTTVIIMAWTPTTISVSQNGAAFAVTSNSTVPANITGTTFEIGSSNFAGNNCADGDMFWFLAGTGTLTNTDAATLGGLGTSDPTFDTLPATANTTFIWSADTLAATAGQSLTDNNGQIPGRVIANPYVPTDGTFAVSGAITATTTITATGAMSATNLDNDGIYYPMQGVTTAVAASPPVSNTTYFQYIGRAKKAWTACSVRYNVVAAATGTVTYAEIGLFRGTPPAMGGNAASLTRVSAPSNNMTNTTGLKTISLSSLTIAAGDDLWLAFSVQAATTTGTYTSTVADTLSTGIVQSQATYRPSTGTSPLTTATAFATAIPAMVAMFS